MEDLKAKTCKDVPALLTSFVDTFVDFFFIGHFFLPEQNPIPRPPLQTYYPPKNGLISIGDLHGDLDKTKQSLRLVNLIKKSDKWVRGSSTVVQVDDVLDRGGDEIRHISHEIMNVEGDFRYVTKEGLDEFVNWADWYSIGNRMKSLCKELEKPQDPFEGQPFVNPFSGKILIYFLI